MKSVLWNGCSFTVGEGFPIDSRDQYIYDRLVNKQFGFNGVNVASGGASNHEIFKKTAQAIYQKKYDLIFTQWSALNRLWLWPGPDCCFFINDDKHPDFNYRDIYLSPEAKTKLRDTLLLLNHDYQNILDLIDYCCIIEHMSKITKTKVIFINGLVPWTQDIIEKVDPSDLNKSLSNYTKEILDFNRRDDWEIILFLEKLQQKFTLLNRSLWVNLFDSMQSNMIDLGPEGHHPGIMSHQTIANKIFNFLNQRKIL